MGTWGPGNFDSDAALDYLGGVIDRLTDTVEELFAEERASLDDQGEGKLMPTVEMISVLCDWCSGAPPHPPQILRWKRHYLEIYDDQIDGLLLAGKEGFGQERRAHIVRTFDRLVSLATDFWKEDPVTPS
jgi:hypothetical protein